MKNGRPVTRGARLVCSASARLLSPETYANERQPAVPRQRTNHSRRIYVLPEDFPERLGRFHRESGLPWAEIARRIETYPLTIRRWRSEGVRPNLRHQTALLALADSLDLGHIFTEWGTLREGRPSTARPARRARRRKRFAMRGIPPRRRVPTTRPQADEPAMV